MTAPDVHVGDRVRVTYTYEGVVCAMGEGAEVSRIGFELDGPGPRFMSPDGAHRTVEVLERAVPKVGDVVKGTDLDHLPEFSVVVTVGSTCVQQKTPSGKWWRAGISGTEIVYPTLDYRVLHVPEDGAE